MLEKQFRNLYEEANRQPGITGENLLRMLELRIDNVVFRAGWGASRNQARQLVRHGHVLVNGKRVTIPSLPGAQGRRRRARSRRPASIIVDPPQPRHPRPQVPPWLDADAERLEVTVRDLPLREQIDVPVREQLIVELYSK